MSTAVCRRMALCAPQTAAPAYMAARLSAARQQHQASSHLQSNNKALAVISLQAPSLTYRFVLVAVTMLWPPGA